MIVLVLVLTRPLPADAHFFGGVTKDLADGYQVLFVPFPATPKAGDNSTRLNFSVLKDGNNVDNIYVSFTIKEKDSGKFEEQLPYKFYEFSDITIPYKFQKMTDYVITVQTRISGDPKYQANPLIANFDIKAKDPNDILSDNPALTGGIGIGVAIAAIASIHYLRSHKKLKEKARRRR
jgi:hypothetical protein